MADPNPLRPTPDHLAPGEYSIDSTDGAKVTAIVNQAGDLVVTQGDQIIHLPKGTPLFKMMSLQLKPATGDGFTPSMPEKTEPMPDRFLRQAREATETLEGGGDGSSLAERTLSAIRKHMEPEPKIAPGTKKEEEEEKEE